MRTNVAAPPVSRICREQDRRCEAERVQCDDPEGEVDRGGDLAVGDRKERRSVEDALQAGQLARH
jgi:hypothetical protein